MKLMLISLIITVCVGNCFAYYSSEQGRWLNRDPIGEDGGVNVYQFCGNNGVDHWDYLGLISDTIDNVDHNANLLQIPVWAEFGNDKDKDKIGGLGAGPGTSRISCTKDQDKDTCEWYINKCTVTWKRIIYMNRSYTGSESASQVYGHEQGHLVSLKEIIEEEIVKTLREASNKIDEDPKEVDRKIKFCVGSYGRQLVKLVKAGDTKQANHVGKNKTPIGVPPLPDSPVIPDFPGPQK